jgi:hypothetical protein
MGLPSHFCPPGNLTRAAHSLHHSYRACVASSAPFHVGPVWTASSLSTGLLPVAIFSVRVAPGAPRMVVAVSAPFGPRIRVGATLDLGYKLYRHHICAARALDLFRQPRRTEKRNWEREKWRVPAGSRLLLIAKRGPVGTWKGVPQRKC